MIYTLRTLFTLEASRVIYDLGSGSGWSFLYTILNYFGSNLTEEYLSLSQKREKSIDLHGDEIHAHVC